MTEKSLPHARVLVVGGSGGLGQAVSRCLAQRGFQPIVAYCNGRPRAEAIAAETSGEVVHLDLTDAVSIDGAATRIADSSAPVVGVVLAAAKRPVFTSYGHIDDSELRGQLEVAAIGQRRLLAGLVRHHFRKSKRGSVIGVLSQAMGSDLKNAMNSAASYVIAKYAMEGVLASMAAEYPWLTVRVVRPGFIDTGMISAFDDRFVQLMKQKQLVASPESVAQDIVSALETAFGTPAKSI